MRADYQIPDQLGADGAEALLRDKAQLVPISTRTEIRTCYDSFDSRLHISGYVLQESVDGAQHTLILRKPGDTRGPIAEAHVPAPPAFTRDLPPGRLHDMLAPVLEMRELQAVVSIRAQVRCLGMLNKDEKTVARVLIEETALESGKGKRRKHLGSRISLLPVKGYHKAAARIAKILQSMQLVADPADPFLSALQVAGITPSTHSTRLNLQLEAHMRSDRAIRLVMHRLLDIMLENEAGTRKGTDTEFLHDFRVAVRRTRSALGQVKGVLPKRLLARYSNEFAWLGKITSKTRDLDVYLLNFDTYRNSLPPSTREDIEPLRTFLHAHWQTEHKALVKALDSARYRRLVESWRKTLEQPVNERSTLPKAARPVYELACLRIWHVYRRILKEGGAIDPDTPAAALHELRKTAKKLRYLMEFFQSLFPPKAAQKLIRVLKALQDNLGRFQDYEVQVATLRSFSRQMVEEHLAEAGTLVAMDMLIEGLEQRQRKARKEFAKRFAAFAHADNQSHFRAMFASRKLPDSSA